MKAFLAGLAAMAVIGAGAFAWHQWDRSKAYAEGQTSERLVWQERQARAEIDADRARKATQAQISRIEADYWRQRAGDRDRISELEKAIDDEKPDATVDASVAGATRCPPAVSKRVRDQLDAIGR